MLQNGRWGGNSFYKKIVLILKFSYTGNKHKWRFLLVLPELLSFIDKHMAPRSNMNSPDLLYPSLQNRTVHTHLLLSVDKIIYLQDENIQSYYLKHD